MITTITESSDNANIGKYLVEVNEKLGGVQVMALRQWLQAEPTPEQIATIEKDFQRKSSEYRRDLLKVKPPVIKTKRSRLK